MTDANQQPTDAETAELSVTAAEEAVSNLTSTQAELEKRALDVSQLVTENDTLNHFKTQLLKAAQSIQTEFEKYRTAACDDAKAARVALTNSDFTKAKSKADLAVKAAVEAIRSSSPPIETDVTATTAERSVTAAEAAVAGLKTARADLENRVSDVVNKRGQFLERQTRASLSASLARTALRHSQFTIADEIANETAVIASLATQDAMGPLVVPDVDELINVRAVAKEWLGASTALFGLFSISGIIFASNALDGLCPGMKILFVVCAVLAVLGGALSIGFGTKAAHGWPHAERKRGFIIKKRSARDPQIDPVDKKVSEAISDLRFAVGTAAVALVFLLACVVVLWLG